MPLTDQDLLKLQRDVHVTTDLYIAIRSNVEQLRLVKAGKIGNVRLVDYAKAPEVLVKPRKLITFLASAMLELLVGAVVSVLKDRLFTGVLDSASLEAHTGLSVFATIPYNERQEEMSRRSQNDGNRSLLFKDCINDAAIESLRTALTFALLKASNNVVLVTGHAPGLGKSHESRGCSRCVRKARAPDRCGHA